MYNRPYNDHHQHGQLARWIKWRACDTGEAKEGLKNELWRRWRNRRVGVSNLSVTSPTSQLILQHFCRLTYITAHSPTLPLLHLCHSSFSNSSFASPVSQALHLIHLASHPWSSAANAGLGDHHRGLPSKQIPGDHSRRFSFPSTELYCSKFK